MNCFQEPTNGFKDMVRRKDFTMSNSLSLQLPMMQINLHKSIRIPVTKG